MKHSTRSKILDSALTRASMAVAFVLSVQTLSASAHAESEGALDRVIQACGNIQVRSNSSCQVILDPPSCNLQCQPLRMRAACSAKLAVACQGHCDAQVRVGCQDHCADVCLPQCRLDAGNFSCQAQCRGGCEIACSARCQSKTQASGQGASFQARCESSCRAQCGTTCSGGCTGDTPSLSCEQRCDKVCLPQCQAKANIDCQVDCQSSGFARCEAELQGGCEAKCRSGQGALFCDGQFVNTQELHDDLRGCVGALNGLLITKVKGYANASCDGKGRCEAEAGISCNVAPQPADTRKRWLWGLLILPAALLGTRRRRSAK